SPGRRRAGNAFSRESACWSKPPWTTFASCWKTTLPCTCASGAATGRWRFRGTVRAPATRIVRSAYRGDEPMSDRLQIVALIDALGWEYVRERTFLDDVLPYRTPL